MPIAQPELDLAPPETVSRADLDQLRAHLAAHGWQTRKEIEKSFGWHPRYIRALAEAMGADIVRGQAGFKLTEKITREELGAALQSADAFLSQSKKMAAYAHDLKKRLHSLIG
jgi:hypothetical protein